MAVVASDIKFYKSLVINDTVSNGGRISSTLIVDASMNNVFPNVRTSDRLAGVTKYRKVFIKNANSSDEAVVNANVWIGAQSSGEDYFRLKAGTDTDVQSEADDYTNWAGAGKLASAVSSGESQILVNFDAADGVFSGEDVWMRMYDGTTYEDIKVVGTPSWNGNQATINISGETQSAFGTTTTVSTKVDLGDLQTGYADWTETSAAGTYDETNYPPILYNGGTISDTWTITFTGATSFSVAGAVTGSIGTGSTASDFQPAGANGYYFKIRSAGWGGTWATGNTITFRTTHSAKAVWIKEVVPPNTPAHSNNVMRIDWQAEVV